MVSFMKSGKRLLIFITSFIIAFVFWRLRVFFSYNNGELPFLREITGLTIHHYHYGLIIILVAALLLIFYKVNSWSVGLMGFGLGSVFDSFVSRLFGGTNRIREIVGYNDSFIFTLVLFANIILLSIIFYYLGRGKV